MLSSRFCVVHSQEKRTIKQPANTSNMNHYLYPKDFIRKIYVDDLDDIVNLHKYHYISFGLLGTGIEFLGKCLNEAENPTWHVHKMGLPKRNFDMALTNLMTRYAPYRDAHKLCDSLRNGMAHAFQPKNRIELTHQDEANERGWVDLTINSNRRLVLVCENLYEAFSNACLVVMKRIDAEGFDPKGKIYKPFLEI